MRSFALTFASIKGTRFYRANLTDADFTGATLKNANFNQAIVTRTCWKDAKKSELLRPDRTLLADTEVRQLLVTSDGYQKSYAQANLAGANLTGANLEAANLKAANLANATLAAANLKNANLAQTQCIGTNFTHSDLTGACLEAWNIDSSTIFDRADCQYVFLREHPDNKGNRDRRPHDPDEVFAQGDFEKLYTEIMNTVQILLRQGITNLDAVREAFAKLIQENPDIMPYSTQSIARKGEDALVALEVPEDADKAQIDRQLRSNYDRSLLDENQKLREENARKDGYIEFQNLSTKEYRDASTFSGTVAREIEGEPTTYLMLSEETYQKLLAIAAQHGTTPGDWIASQLRDAFQRDRESDQRPLSERLDGLVGAIDSREEPHPSPEPTPFEDIIAAKLAKQGIRQP